MEEYHVCIKTHEDGDFRTLRGPSRVPLYSHVKMGEGVNWAWAGVMPPKAPSRRVPDTRPCEVRWYSPAYDKVSDDVINVNRGGERDVLHIGCAWGWVEECPLQPPSPSIPDARGSDDSIDTLRYSMPGENALDVLHRDIVRRRKERQYIR